MNPLSRLVGLGTSVWVDGLVPPAELERLVREDSVTGLTSNPTIFRVAVLGNERYGDRIAALGAPRRCTRRSPSRTSGPRRTCSHLRAM